MYTVRMYSIPIQLFNERGCMTPYNQKVLDEIEVELRQIQFKLNLLHWRIEISEQKAKNGALFEVVTNRLRNHASIRLSDDGVASDDRVRCLTHELLHLVFDPIREEHDFEMEQVGGARRKEYSNRMLRQIEKAVEHLSYVV